MTTVTRKGQVTIPKPVRDALGIVPGSDVSFIKMRDGGYVLTRTDADPDRFYKLRGDAGPGMTTDEIMALTRGPYDDVD